MNEITNTELKDLTLEQLALKANELQHELFQLRLRAATTPVRSFSSDQRKLKKSIARVRTHERRVALQSI